LAVLGSIGKLNTGSSIPAAGQWASIYLKEIFGKLNVANRAQAAARAQALGLLAER
jgi:hypothetical protein